MRDEGGSSVRGGGVQKDGAVGSRDHMGLAASGALGDAVKRSYIVSSQAKLDTLAGNQ